MKEGGIMRCRPLERTGWEKRSLTLNSSWSPMRSSCCLKSTSDISVFSATFVYDLDSSVYYCCWAACLFYFYLSFFNYFLVSCSAGCAFCSSNYEVVGAAAYATSFCCLAAGELKLLRLGEVLIYSSGKNWKLFWMAASTGLILPVFIA